MPTGYTAGVADGEITELRDYALLCARAFGPTIRMRDEPLDAPIREFKPSPYHAEKLEESRRKLAQVEMLTDEEAQQMAEKQYAEQVSYRQECLEDLRETRRRYEAMLEKVRQYTAPSYDHVNFRLFMERQLEESIKFDCSEEYYTEPVKVDGPTWKMEEMQRLREDIDYHLKNQQEEEERVESANRWIAELRKSLE